MARVFNLVGHGGFHKSVKSPDGGAVSAVHGIMVSIGTLFSWGIHHQPENTHLNH